MIFSRVVYNRAALALARRNIPPYKRHTIHASGAAGASFNVGRLQWLLLRCDECRAPLSCRWSMILWPALWAAATRLDDTQACLDGRRDDDAR